MSDSVPIYKTPTVSTSLDESLQKSSFLHPAEAYISSGTSRPNRPWSSSSCNSAARKSASKKNFTPASNSFSNDGTSSRSKSSTTPQSCYNSKLVAIVEGRGKARGEIGMACIDLRSPVLHLSQFADTQAYPCLVVQLNVLQPLEVIMPNTVMDFSVKTKLICRIQELFPEIITVTVPRKYFNETKGLQLIQELCASEYKSVEIEVSPKYYCLAACAALLKYVENKSNTLYASHSLKIVYSTSADTTMISTSTACNLELVTNEVGKIEHCLYKVLNHTQTPGGDRLLRANILQPPCDLSTINARLDCITELIGNEELFYNLKSVISKFVDTEHLLSLCIQTPKEENVRSCEQKIANVICLKHALELVLSDERFAELQDTIGLVIHTDARWQKGVLNMHMQKCFAVKPNINGLLDVARRAYSESVNDISEIVKQLETQYDLPLHVGFSANRGFFIQIPSKLLPNGKELPATFLKVNKYKSFITCTTEDLIKLNDRIQESLNEIYIMSDLIINEVLNEIRGKIGCLYSLTEAVSTIDFLLSLAKACTLSDHVRPEFTDTTAIQCGRHPVIERIIGTTFIPNHIYLCEEMNFIVLTGANMSGKSTYLKQVAVLQIMAQMGSYVPAEYASFRITDQILTHMGSSYDIEKNYSTFMLQMKEASYILQHATEKSLILMDELGKGTNYEEGCALAFAISEQLLMTKAFVISTTHFNQLIELSAIYPNVDSLHFEVEYVLNQSKGCVFNFTHTLTSGAFKERHYGIKLAKLSSMPEGIVTRAETLVTTWSESDIDKSSDSELSNENKDKVKLVIHLVQITRNSLLDEESLRKHLQALQAQCIPNSDVASVSDKTDDS